MSYGINFGRAVSPVKNRLGEMSNHYLSFTDLNDEGVCPYCGIADIESIHISKREAYDHFLPKGVYPFNSINFANLAPMCHKCNSTYKHSKDPLLDNDGTPRPAFYSYAEVDSDIEINVELKSINIDSLLPDEIELKIYSTSYPEKTQTWLTLFGLEGRYKEKLSAKNSGKAWCSMMMDEFKNFADTPTPATLLELQRRRLKAYPFASPRGFVDI